MVSLDVVAVQLILEVHTGVDLLIHHLGPKTGGSNLLAQRRFLLAGLPRNRFCTEATRPAKPVGAASVRSG